MNSSNLDVLVQLKNSQPVHSALIFRIREHFLPLRSLFSGSSSPNIGKSALLETDQQTCQKQLAIVETEIQFLQSVLRSLNSSSSDISVVKR